MLENLKSMVEFAYENVPLYRRLYREKPVLGNPDNFSRLPYLTRNHFALCCTEDVLSDLDEAVAVLPPIKNKTIFPFPRLESAYDRDCRYEVFYYLLEQASVSDNSSFLIITDTEHSYYCGEIANNLLYYKYPTWMMFLRDHSHEEIKSWIERFSPDHLLLGLDYIPDDVVNWGVNSIFTINQYYRDMSSTDGISHFDIYAVTEVGWIAIRLPGGGYIYPKEYFYIEATDNILVLTTLESWLQPFIRYKTFDKGHMVNKDKFKIRYIGEH
jgi:hypothetical protein